MTLIVDWREQVERRESEALMFSTWSGKPISPNNVVRRWIVPACETLGPKRVGWLPLRRTYSSWAHEKGVPGRVIALLMGHAKVDTTLNLYAGLALIRTSATRESGIELATGQVVRGTSCPPSLASRATSRQPSPDRNSRERPAKPA